MRNITLIFASLLTCLIFNISNAQESKIIFEGVPVKRIVSNIDGSKENLVEGNKKDEFRVIIIKQGEKYHWTTRENKELFPVVSGIYLFFISPSSGYVKINTSTNEYFEHMSLGLSTYTYWGNGVKLNLE